MAKEYNVGDRLYLPVWVTNKETSIMMGVRTTDATFSYMYWHGETRSGRVRYGEPGLLLTANEVAQDVNTERDDALAELKSRNAELEALLKEVMATRDEAIKQNDELIAENKKLKADCNEWKDAVDKRIIDIQTLTAERDNLKADLTTQKEVNEELKAWYEEANKTASEAAEANDELKTQIAELKAERDKFAKTAKDKADIANKACDERNDVQGDLETAKAIVDHLQEENKDLKQKLEDAEACYTVVADTSIKRKNRVTTMEEVIVALVEKIRRLEGEN